MRKLKSPSRRHVEAELAALRALPQVLNVAALERGEALLTGYHGDLSTDETLYVLRGNGTLVAYSTATGAVTGIGTMCGGQQRPQRIGVGRQDRS